MSTALQSAGDLAITQATGPALMNRYAHRGTAHDIEQSAKDFESMFMAQMLQPMFETVGVDRIFGGGHGEEVMRSFLVQEYGKVAAKNSHLGIAAAVQSELMRAQEKMKTNNAVTNNGATNVIGQVQ